eukprot:SAG11_NODE_10100_length_855_cov_1.064815_1_plen_51_part_10
MSGDDLASKRVKIEQLICVCDDRGEGTRDVKEWTYIRPHSPSISECRQQVC